MINIIINTFNLHNSVLNNDNRYMQVTLKSKLMRVVIEANFGRLFRILNRHMADRTKGKLIFLLKKSALYAIKFSIYTRYPNIPG